MAPTFVLEREGTWTTNPSAQTTATFDASAGDVLVLVAMSSGTPAHTWTGPTNSGAALTWTLVQSSTTASYSPIWLWTAILDTARTGMTVTLTVATGTETWGIDLTLWRGASVGASAITTGSGAPSLSLTTTAASSAVLVFDADYNAGSGSSRTWRTGAGTATELVYSYNGGTGATYYGAYHTDAGTAAAKTLGLSAPTGQTYTIVGVELKAGTPVAITAPVGAATAAGTAPTVTAPHPAAITATVGAATASGTAPTVVTMRDWGEWRAYVWDPDYMAAVEARQRTVGFGAEMIDPSGRVVCVLPIASGSIDFDGESAEQWACSLTVVGGEWVPRQPTDVLDPRSGLRCRLSWKLKVGAQWLYVPVGTYWLEDPKIRDGGDAVTIGLTGRDPLAIVRRGGYGAATVVLGGLTVAAAIERIMAVVAPQLPLRIDATSTVTLPSPYEVGSRDPLEDVLTIAALGGLVVRSDREGAVLVSLPPATDVIRADWQEGDDCPVTDLDRGLQTSSMVNSVTVVSTSPDVKPPVSATVEDDDPSSPTYIGGVWGRRGVTIRSDAVATVEAAANLARATLAGRRRPTESVVVQVPPRGDLSYGDLVALGRVQAGAGGLFRVAKWRLPITEVGTAPPLMSVTMQTRSTA